MDFWEAAEPTTKTIGMNDEQIMASMLQLAAHMKAQQSK